MVWNNASLFLYHGTDATSAGNIRKHGIDPRRFRPKTDFGAGFYVTTVPHQAAQWANQRCRRMSRTKAEVLVYKVERSTLETLRHLTFILDDADYYAFIAYCRNGGSNHGPSPRRKPYQIVYGPVSLWPQTLVVSGCDQIMFADPTGAREFKTPHHSLSPPSGQVLF